MNVTEFCRRLKSKIVHRMHSYNATDPAASARTSSASGVAIDQGDPANGDASFDSARRQKGERGR